MFAVVVFASNSCACECAMILRDFCLSGVFLFFVENFSFFLEIILLNCDKSVDVINNKSLRTFRIHREQVFSVHAVSSLDQ